MLCALAVQQDPESPHSQEQTNEKPNDHGGGKKSEITPRWSVIREVNENQLVNTSQSAELYRKKAQSRLSMASIIYFFSVNFKKIHFITAVNVRNQHPVPNFLPLTL